MNETEEISKLEQIFDVDGIVDVETVKVAVRKLIEDLQVFVCSYESKNYFNKIEQLFYAHSDIL
jgi:ferritin-like metal-binding protein YciE